MSQSNSFLQADEQDESNLKKNALSDMKSFIYLLKYAQPYRYKFLLAIILMMSSSFFSLASARLMGFFVELGLLKGDSQASMNYGIAIVGVSLISFLAMWWGRRLLSLYSSLSIFDIRKDLFEHLQLLPVSFFDTQPQGRVVTRVTHDVEGIEQFFTSTLGRLVSATFLTIMAVTAMLYTHFWLGLILVGSIAPVVLFIYLTRNMVRNVNRRMSKNGSALNSKLSEFINGLSVIRSFGLESWSKKEYNKSVDAYERSHLDANFLYAWSRPLISLMCTAPIILLVWFGGKEVLAGAMGVGIFVSFIRYCERFLNPVMTLAREIHVVQQAFTSAERVVSFLNHKVESYSLGDNGTITGKNHTMKGEIEFKDVWMAYGQRNNNEDIKDDDWVLKGLNFKIETGEKIGLVGRTGCGKSTTVNLISRLYEFQKGEILIDGIDIRKFNREYLRSMIGFVAQDPVLFHGSMSENLCPMNNVDRETIARCCEDTGLSRVMSRNGFTLDTEIYEGGSNLSVGERQLVALTRILINNPKILILDEATANIDPAYEKIIHEAVDKVMEGRTCLMIAHRLATVEYNDQIFVFDDGQLVERGNKEELFAMKGYFHNLHNAQF
ncbi:MAG: ABC transporter ATP-binding protein [Oligoflexia bacterium]|nr:ABC transporter ATP-binding protein [Oligoflexia bacterium]